MMIHANSLLPPMQTNTLLSWRALGVTYLLVPSGKQFENDMQLYLMLYMMLDDIPWYQKISINIIYSIEYN
jgi:hypothetical protein